MLAARFAPQAGPSTAYHTVKNLLGRPNTACFGRRTSLCRRQQHGFSDRLEPRASDVAIGAPFQDPENSPDKALSSEPMTAGTALQYGIHS